MVPSFEMVLAAVVPGRAVRLDLSREQKRALRDPDGQIALDVLRHFLSARDAATGGGAPGRFPLVEHVFQAVARKLGYEVGQKRCRAFTRRLVREGVIGSAGHYRQPYKDTERRSGFRVALFRVLRGLLPSDKGKHPVGRRQSVKPQTTPRWWQHPLFGDISGLPPPHLLRRVAARMRSLDELNAREIRS